MEAKVKLSRFSLWLTYILNVILYGGCIACVRDGRALFIILAVFLILTITGLYYGPLAIKADKQEITIVSLLKKRRIKMSDIESVELFQPTMGAIRICASGGYMGYWGMFSEGDVGKYMAFYGKASDCFMIHLKGGGKLVLGCENPDAMVEYIKSQI